MAENILPPRSSSPPRVFVLLRNELAAHLVEYRVCDTALLFIVELDVMVCVRVFEAAQGFMLPSKTGVDYCDRVLDSIGYGVRVAGRKMQEGYFTECPPVSAVNLLGFIIEKGHRDALSRRLGY